MGKVSNFIGSLTEEENIEAFTELMGYLEIDDMAKIITEQLDASELADLKDAINRGVSQWSVTARTASRK